ncbi:MAG: hypothetical protein PHY12_01840 [Eubacteriales bacterium]|nr:hypothetical protein [Eubacteriales bacterium]
MPLVFRLIQSRLRIERDPTLHHSGHPLKLGAELFQRWRNLGDITAFPHTPELWDLLSATKWSMQTESQSTYILTLCTILFLTAAGEKVRQRQLSAEE